MLEDVISAERRPEFLPSCPKARRIWCWPRFVFWSAVHGLTMLAIDHLMGPGVTVDDMIEQLLRIQIRGLRTA